MALPAEVIDEAVQWLVCGVPIRAVARAMAGRISRSSVGNVYHGRQARCLSAMQPSNETDLEPPSGPIARCRCGRLVQQPCLACQLEAERARRGDGPRHIGGVIAELLAAKGIVKLGVELTGGARERYEEIRARKIAEDRKRAPPRRRTIEPARNQIPLFDFNPPPWELDDQ
jgi:hypothetical protein